MKMKENYQKRLENTINEIYELTNRRYFGTGFARYRKNSLFVKCGSALRKLDVIGNKGTSTSPKYYWKSDSPTKELYKVVYNVITGNCSVENKTCFTGEPYTAKINPSTFSIKSLEDKELWVELKSRGYTINNNKLCKITYLQ